LIWDKAYANVNVGDVSYYVVLSVQDWEGRDAFVVHELEGVGEGFVAAVAWSV
jgi:hypothetical protein